MSTGTALQFIVSHNALIIESLIALVLILVIYLAYRGFRETTSPHVASGSMENIEATLQKILEKAQSIPKSTSDGGPEAQALLSQIDQLRTELQEKQTTIEQMKSASSGGGGSISEDEKKVLEEQLKDLQGKLSEYEIISEDIADLSKYKEENMRLQRELEKARSNTGSVAAPAAAPAPQTTVAPAAPAPEPIVAAPPAAAPAQETVSGGGAVDDDMMAEFARAVEEQKKMTVKGKAPAQDAGAITVKEPDALPEVDMTKMIAEASGIEENLGSVEVTAEEALGKELDENKLLAEADALTAPEQSISADDAQLLGEFENFVKKKG